ncbi:MAG: hypothetical protein O7G85_02900 [Planctomycetota bacterium]|nr:hypothetical protein [Planctomycetota bacterium]
MSDKDESLSRELRSLGNDQWHAPEHCNALEQELLNMHRATSHPSRKRRFKMTIIALLLLTFTGGGLAATHAYLNKQVLYSFIIRYQGEIVASPRVLVLRGQTASCSITNGDETYTVLIHFDGSTTFEGPPDYEVDLEIEEVNLDE